MKIGFLTGCLKNMPLFEKAEFAHAAGFEALEISCWPEQNDRDYSGNDIDVANLTPEKAKEISDKMQALELEISSLAYYDNTLSANPEERAAVNAHIHKVIDAAQMLGVKRVGVFAGRDISKDIAGNFDEFERIFTGLVDYAEQRGVMLMIENCQMHGWLEPDKPGTISYSPELWREMFRRVPSRNFGLNYDPSHLHVMLMDYMQCLEGFEDRVVHLHAKDAEVFADKVAQYGVYNGQFGDSFWRYRMPSLGQVDWEKLLEHLQSHEYDYVVSIEHEDPLYSGNLEQVKEGLVLGLNYLKRVLGK